MFRQMKVAVIGMTALTAASAHAQSLNIDMNTTGLVPTPVYMAAAGQAGTWNSFGGGVATPLLGLNGLASGVTISSVGTANYSSTTLGYTGDLANLLNDVLDSPTSVTLGNLAAGQYNIYTYATDPDVPATAGTIVTINGISQTIIGPAVVAGNLIQGTHYALHSVNHAGGNLTINLADAPGNQAFWNLNGIQVVLVPGPGSLAFFGLGMLGMRRRRR